MIVAIMDVQPHDQILVGVLPLWSRAVPPGDLASVRPHLRLALPFAPRSGGDRALPNKVELD